MKTNKKQILLSTLNKLKPYYDDAIGLYDFVESDFCTESMQDNIARYLLSYIHTLPKIDYKKIYHQQSETMRQADIKKADDILKKLLDESLEQELDINSLQSIETARDSTRIKTYQELNKFEPKNFILSSLDYKEGYTHSAITKLVNWYEQYLGSTRLNQLKSSLKTPNKFKTDPDSYVRYEIAKQAIQKYSELLYQQKDQVLIKYRRSGEKYESETKKLIKVNELLQNEFPNAQKYQEQLSKYSQDIEVISKKHRYDKPGIYEKHATLYKKYEKEIKESVDFAEVEKAKKIVVNIDSITDEESMKKYMQSYQLMLQSNNTINSLQEKYGPLMLKGFINYNKDVQKINGKYGQTNLTKMIDYLSDYDTKFKNAIKNNDIDLSTLQKINKDLTNLNYFGNSKSIASLRDRVIVNPGDKNNSHMRGGVVIDHQEKKIRQDKIDAFYTFLKVASPTLYNVLNITTGAWNGLIDATLGTGSSIGMLIMSLRKSDDELKASMDLKQSFDNFFKISRSTSMSEPLIQHSQDGKTSWNWTVDNAPGEVANAMAHMFVLIEGGGVISKGITKVTGEGIIMASTSSKIGLFSSSMIQSVGNNFIEAKKQGLGNREAYIYSMMSSISGSALELISPNNLLIGNRSNVIKNLVGSGGKKKLTGLFIKHMIKEVGAENMQESLQTIVQKSINGYINNERQVTFDDKFTWQDFANTALLTTLTTSIVSTRGAYQQANIDAGLDQDGRNKLISDIVPNQVLYFQIMSSLNNIIDGKVKVNIVDVGTALSLKQELESAKKGYDLLQSHTKQVRENIKNENVSSIAENLNNKDNKVQSAIKNKEQIQTNINIAQTNQLISKIIDVLHNTKTKNIDEVALGEDLSHLESIGESLEVYKNNLIESGPKLGDISYSVSPDGILSDLVLTIDGKQIDLSPFIPKGVEMCLTSNYKQHIADPGQLQDIENRVGQEGSFYHQPSNKVYISDGVLFKPGGLAVLLHELGHVSDPLLSNNTEKLVQMTSSISGSNPDYNQKYLQMYENNFVPEQSRAERTARAWMLNTLRSIGKSSGIDTSSYGEYSRKFLETTLMIYKINKVIDLANTNTQIGINSKTFDKMYNKKGTKLEPTANYFDGKKSRFELTETQARENSAMMDKVIAEIMPENQSQKLQELRETIATQYKQHTGKELSLTDEQLLSLMDAHEQDGILGELTSGQLRVKTKKLAETIADPEVRRFLLEAGFSGSIGTFLGKLFGQRGQPESAQTKTENGVEKKHNIDGLNTLIKEFDAIQDKSFNGLYKVFIEDIRSDTSYKDIFDSSVGVPDLGHETLRRHTSLVLNKFAEVESEYIIKDEYKDLIKKMILIHDIPKVFALKMGLEKSDQHTIAKAIIPSILDSLDITGAEKEIMNFMLCNDVIGETIQGTLTTEKYNNYKQKIYKLSRTANIGVQTLFEMQLLFYNSDAGSYAFLKHIFYDWSSTKSYEKFFMNLDPSLKRFGEIRNESIHIQESYKVGTPLEYYGKIKTFVDGLSIEEKKYLFREIINTTRTYGVTSMKKVSASMNSSEYGAWSLGLYAGELSGMYNSFNRGVIDENVCYSQLYILSYLGDLFLKKARLEDKVFDNYVQHKLLYRDITLKSDSKLFDEIVSLNPGDIYSDKGYFSTTEFAKISIGEYYNPYRGMPIDELEEKLRNIKNESHNQKYNDEINIGKAISADKDGTYAIKFIVTNSHSGVKIDQYVSTYHTDKETEVLFLPGTEWKVLRKKIDENKKTILITVEQI